MKGSDVVSTKDCVSCCCGKRSAICVHVCCIEECLRVGLCDSELYGAGIAAVDYDDV